MQSLDFAFLNVTICQGNSGWRLALAALRSPGSPYATAENAKQHERDVHSKIERFMNILPSSKSSGICPIRWLGNRLAVARGAGFVAAEHNL